MKSFKEYLLLERTPERFLLDKDKSIVDYLISKDKNSTYFTFTNVHKLGINPINRYYETPIGIYSYPLEFYYDKIKKTRDFSSIPFQAIADYVCVFSPKATSSKRIIHFDSYSESSLEEDIKRLGNKYEKIIVDYNPNDVEDRRIKPERIKSYLNNLEKRLKETDYKSPLYSKLKQEEWRALILFRGLDTQPYSSRSKTESSHKHIIDGYIIGKEFRDKKFTSWDEFVDFILSTYKLKGIPASRLFSFSQILSLYLTSKFIHSDINTTKWRSILSNDLGILGLIDPGYGIIHEKVKTQALWLDLKELTLDKIFNNIKKKSSSFHEREIVKKEDIFKMSKEEIQSFFNPSFSKKELIESMTKGNRVFHSDFVFKDKETLQFILHSLGLSSIKETNWK